MFELRALLVEQEGPNLRHNIAHGLLDDSQAWGAAALYVWWLCLRMVVVPLWMMQRPPESDDASGEGSQG